MTYTQIFDEIYRKNKKFIIAYITLSLLFSIFSFGNGEQVLADNGFTTQEAITTLGGSGGQMLLPLTLSTGCLSGIDASSAMLFLSAAALILDFIPQDTLVSLGDTLGIEALGALSDYSFGLIDYHVFKVFCLLWFIITKLSKSNNVSHEVALILESAETKIGVFVNFLIIGSQFLANVPLGMSVQAASNNANPGNVITYTFNALWCFILLMAILVIYFFTRYLFYFVDILLIPICSFVPCSAFGIETIKTIFVGILLYIAIFHPAVFYVIAALIFIVAIILFKTAYITIRYFKNIYVKPFFRKFRGYDNEISLVSPKLPKKVKHYLADSEVEIAVPAYILKKLRDNKVMHLHDRWWFIVTKEKQFLLKPRFIKNECHMVEIQNSPDKKVFIKKSLRFFEVFNLNGSEDAIGKTFRKVKKDLHFVYSKEYFHRFDDIKEITVYTDYTEYRNQIRQSMKLSREEKRLAKKEAREEARLLKKQAREEKLLLRRQSQI